ncbi:3'(2'),5'-bisphosphate nucleotidase [Kaistia algarum]|uniref:3'(2'),5'-bisphosphate nucleotidase CysQ n=1 Tax=Kaistia algarum TaxID=2083279 RepID=UPI000CE7EBDC|nr:3'(2'),5'-bisphosphate nucleotidase CysQ [Kaistia algarum]MCX5513562.1 3'(2'),5'-bisphosphate nucleotidase CysQ [Kaistia algarum]PPE77665.1 3'(2'),5'-bisphosphate nucleotidase [Kaistia algarum]
MILSIADPSPLASLADTLVATALAAGEAVMAIYGQDFCVDAKSDASPVTEADRLAEAIILADLAKLAPDIPVIAEEACCAGIVPDVTSRFFLVDPVDGTREFVGRNGEFTVNIALVEDGEPVFGIVYAPALGVLFMGRAGLGAEEMKIAAGAIVARRAITVATPSVPPRIVASRSHRTPETDDFLAEYPDASIVPAGSSLKFCLLASGKADLYPRFGPTMQWDTAAGDAVLRAAGGSVTTPDGDLLRYGPSYGLGIEAYRNSSFIAWGGSARPAGQ